MPDNEKLAYDLALIYARTKFEAANRNGIIGNLFPNNEPEAELKVLAMFFNDAYNEYLSRNISEITEL